MDLKSLAMWASKERPVHPSTGMRFTKCSLGSGISVPPLSPLCPPQGKSPSKSFKSLRNKFLGWHVCRTELPRKVCNSKMRSDAGKKTPKRPRRILSFVQLCKNVPLAIFHTCPQPISRLSGPLNRDLRQYSCDTPYSAP